MTDPPSPIRPQPLELSSSRESVRFFHEQVLDNLYDGVYFVDAERRIIYWNKGAEQLTGYSPTEAVGRYCFDNFLMHVDDEGCALCVGHCPLAATLADGQRRGAEIYLRHKLGHRVPVSVRIAPITDSTDRVIGAVEVFSDISAKKKVERRAGELETLAFCDALTGVTNRRYLELKVKQAIQEVGEFSRSIGLLMIDVDDFKDVNDTYGHDIGDLALKAVSNTLTHNLRPGDTVGRWGGEEFLIIALDVDPTSLMALAERCRMLVAESAVPVGKTRIRVTISIGATLIHETDSGESALKRSDQLLYRSKTSGRNRSTLG